MQTKKVACYKQAEKQGLKEKLTVRLVQMGVKALVPQANNLFPFTSSTLM